MDYFKTLKESFDIWWKNKYLWILGIIAVIFSGSGSSSFGNTSSNNTDFSSLQKNISSIGPALTIIIIAIVCIVLIITVIGIYLKSRADASLISSIPLIEKNGKLGFKKSWSLSSSSWLKLFLLNLVLSIPILIFILLVVLVVVLLYFANPNVDTNVVMLTLMCAGIPLICLIFIYSVFTRVIYTFASRISVLNNVDMWDSVKKGWNFIKSNFSNILVFWLINMAIGIVTGSILGLIGLVFILPIMLLMIPLMVVNLLVGIVVGGLLILVMSAVLSLASGPIYSFGEIYWTKVYLTLKKENA